ncbi:MAG: T9SS type A sorting domain-containing protein, partial [Candidatus Cloacimonetes bacterium]|nr:T9SS type A sorting domain-containing protein [Candidatus Cloacimonadota bacterium]
GYDIYQNEPIYVAIDEPTPENPIELYTYPNPFNKSTTFSYSGQSNLTNEPVIKIFNLKGQLIKQLPLVTQSQSPKVSVTWVGSDMKGAQVSPGIYFYKSDLNNKIIYGKVVRF